MEHPTVWYESFMKRTLAIAALIAFPLAGCGDDYEFKGTDGAIDHCKNIATKKAGYASSYDFTDMAAYDLGDRQWSVTGKLAYVNIDETRVTRGVRCWVEFDEGMWSDDASVRAQLTIPQ